MSGSPANKPRLSKKDFSTFIGKAEVARCGRLTIFRRKNAYPYARLGITMKGKFSSVDRHAAKRVLREAFRLNSDLFSQGFDYNIILKSEVTRGERRFLGAEGRYKLKRTLWACLEQRPSWKMALPRPR